MGTVGAQSGHERVNFQKKFRFRFRSPIHSLRSMGWWCSGILSGLLRRRSGVQIPDPPTLEKCAKGICLCNLLRSTQPNDRETVIEG